MIAWIVDFLHRHLIVLLAAALVPMKIFILRICRDDAAERAALISVPEDLVYVSLGLVLGDVSSSGGAFRKYFQSSPEVTLSLIVTVAIGVTVAMLVHVLAKSTSKRMQGFQAASSLLESSTRSISASAEADPKTSNLRLIQVGQLAWFCFLYLSQLSVAGCWLMWIANIVRG